jgi:hypothetical protein
MEGLRYTLFAPSASSFILVLGVMTAVKENISHRYAAKDEDGNPVLKHPYSPWEATDPKYKELTDKAWRAFKMAENVKEWTFASLPLVWIVGIFGGSLPYVSDDAVTAFLLGTSLTFAYANHKFIKGYVEAPENRIAGFKLRMKVFQVWLLGSGVSLLGYFLQATGTLKL